VIKWILVLAVLVAYPHFVPPFWVVNIAAYGLVLGIITLSLTFLAAYGGMVSLAQMSVAGIAGYALAIASPHAANAGAIIYPWPLTLALAIVLGTLAGLLVGMIAIRTQGISLLMLTLALGMVFFYLTQQNTSVFHGFDGFRGVSVPLIGGKSLREPITFYYLCLGAGTLLYLAVIYLVKTPFGLSLQGIRDNPRRMAALGYWVPLHQVAAFGVAGFIASIGGVLSLWYHTGISPGSIGMTAMVNILIIAVIGGMRHPQGALWGALIFVLIQNFAVDLFSRDRFNSLIGLTFLTIVLCSPDGLVGLYEKGKRYLKRTRERSSRTGKDSLTPGP
jgi:branched-chain amino acid transport system permease protein